jgi:hypothetical protein
VTKTLSQADKTTKKRDDLPFQSRLNVADSGKRPLRFLRSSDIACSIAAAKKQKTMHVSHQVFFLSKQQLEKRKSGH